MEKVLITGGAGFIGNSVVNGLYKKYELTVLDNFSPQIHGDDFERSYLYQSIKDRCQIIKGDVTNPDDMAKALDGADYVVHLAAETGTGQSMYEINRYTNVNIMGTSNLFETIMRKKANVKKIVLSSSRSVYGEGSYRCSEHGIVTPTQRDIAAMKSGGFEVKCPVCGADVELVATTEESQLSPISYYAYTKMAQEKILEVMCPTLDIPYTIFRYQNVYGAGQSLNNPYTGILSIFSKLLLADKPLNIFEDGRESRDFVHVKDVTAITCSALENAQTDNQYINVGTGKGISVLEVAETLKRLYASSSEIKITGDFRKGDIRHNIADIRKAKELCGFSPSYSFDMGMEEFTQWVKVQNEESKLDAGGDFERSLDEMKATGVLING